MFRYIVHSVREYLHYIHNQPRKPQHGPFGNVLGPLYADTSS